MGFSEPDKLEVKRKAAFQCCRCRSIGVEVHHIIPQEAGGPDDIDNAAPLCPNCHSYYGGNPDKRKEITQMRDWWYEVVAQQFGGSQNSWLFGQITQVHETVNRIAASQDKRELELQKDFQEMKSALKAMSDKFIDDITPGTVIAAASSIINTVSSPLAGEKPDSKFAKLENMMPDLFTEMREDLASYPLRREFVILEKAWAYGGKASELRYYFEDHPELESKLLILQNYELIQEITYSNVRRFVISEDLASYLTG